DIPDFASSLCGASPDLIAPVVNLPEAANATAVSTPDPLIGNSNRPAPSGRPAAGDAVEPGVRLEPLDVRWNTSYLLADGSCHGGISLPADLDPAELLAQRGAMPFHVRDSIEMHVDTLERQREASEKDLVEVGRNTTRGGGFDIVYQLTPSVASNAEFVQALETAALVWETYISDSVTVNVLVDRQALSPGVIAQAARVEFGFDYSTVRQMMAVDASVTEVDLTNALPFPDARFRTPNGQSIPSNSSSFGALSVVSANAKALDDTFAGGSLDSFITFSTAFQFDNDPTDGVPQGMIDTVYVMVHEIGHMLGFVSDTDSVSFQHVNGSPYDLRPTPLDLFRFGNGSGENPNTLADFTAFSRTLDFQNEASLDTAGGVEGINRSFPFSSGVLNDGRQSSHWKDDVLSGEFIGVMDPTAGISAAGPADPFQDYLTTADLLAFSLIGWDISLGEAEVGCVVPIPRVRLIPLGGSDGGTGVPNLETAFGLENLDLELWRENPGGGGSQKIAASRTIYNTTEMIYIGPNTGAGGDAQDVPFGNYFIRILYAGTLYDFGGFLYVDPNAMVPSPEETKIIEGYDDLPAARIQY
ncbi:MAG: NF038122 family metalloprotease, partial [Planctomycetota bacterium]|nr:NF038122 family metalloprotease [Planctomycetota bacterium]